MTFPFRPEAFTEKLTTTRTINVEPGYETLLEILLQAYEQAAHGKGRQRHAGGQPFEDQPMQTISALLGTERGMAFQAIKKLREGLDLPSHEARVNELLGAINYIAGIVLYLSQREVDSASVTIFDEPIV